MPRPTVTVFLDGTDEEIALPGKFEVCSRCDGHGTHVNPAIDGNGLSAEDFEEAGPEFRDDYMAGAYDVACEVCGGARVVAVPDFERWTPEQRTSWERQEQARADLEREEAAERRMGA
jgi:hypothetical protein